MDWLLQNWQSVAAPAVVVITAMIFLRRALRRGKGSCGGDCACPAKKGVPGSKDPGPTDKRP